MVKEGIKRGFTTESLAKAKANRRPRREKMAAYAATFAEQRKRFPRMALPIVDKSEAGSVPAAVKLMCLDCSGWVRAEVRDCVVHYCPLYPHRPYQALLAKNPNDVGERGMTAQLREQIGLPKSAASAP